MGAPWFKLYASDLLADSKIRLLTDEQLGQLLKLWCFACVDGSIPSDLAIANRLLGIATSNDLAWVQQFFVVDPDDPSRMLSSRMMREQSNYNDKCEKLRQNASLGGKKKAANRLANAKANALANALANPSEPEPEPEKDIPPTPLKGERKPRARKGEGESIGEYPQELGEAMAVWRDLFKSLKDPEVLDRYPPEKQFLATGVGTRAATWRAWKHRLSQTHLGERFTDSDILGGVRMWAAEKLRQARNGNGLSGPRLATMLNRDDFEDAMVICMDKRMKGENHAA